MNILVKIYFYCSQVPPSSTISRCVFSYKKSPNFFLKWLYYLTLLSTMSEFWFLHILGNIWYCQSYNFSHSSGCVVVSYWGLNLHYLIAKNIWHLSAYRPFTDLLSIMPFNVPNYSLTQVLVFLSSFYK